MKKHIIGSFLSIAPIIAFLTACNNVEPAGTCALTTEVTYSSPVGCGGAMGVDMVLVVDKSPSMEEEQQILSTAIFPLINALVNPLPTWDFEATENIRIAIVSSDMGLQWGGNAFSESDGFPAAALSPACSRPLGDNGVFVNNYAGSDTREISVAPGVIRCTQRADQCPPGWSCDNIDPLDGDGVCNPPDGAAAMVSCPPAPESMGSSYLTLKNDPDDTIYLYKKNELALATSCLSQLGSAGCEIQQPLVAAAVGLENPGQGYVLLREKALLVVLVISDKDDCSINNGPSLFASDEIQDDNGARLATACGNNPEALFSAAEIRDRFYQAKAGVSGRSASGFVVFAAITGVPPVDACQGKGSRLAGCLANEKMQLIETSDPSDAEGRIVFSPACTREVDGQIVSEATPGRRYVELAQEYGSMSYVYSICNPDWSPAMDEIARLISPYFSSGCCHRRFGWDPATETSTTSTVVRVSGTECPPGYPWPSDGVPVGSEDMPVTACTIPAIPGPQECAAIGTPEYNAIKDALQSEFGWYYCENPGENFSTACYDGIDNDGDRQVDCEDEECGACKNCAADGIGDTELCQNKCIYNVLLSDSALDAAPSGVYFQTIVPVNPDDPNCMENTTSACSDMMDNNGNGTFDCDNISLDEAEADETLGPARNADPGCCPIGDSPAGGTCNISPDDVTPICGDTPDWPDACVEAAKLLSCILPAR